MRKVFLKYIQNLDTRLPLGKAALAETLRQMAKMVEHHHSGL
jgi:hypothetical protein